MSAPEIEPQLASEFARQKKMAVQHSARVIWIIVALFVAGVAVGLGTWFIQQPIDRDDVHGGLALGLGAATFCFGCLLYRLLFPRPTAKCPQCGYVWESQQEGGHDWLTWKCCPGCGLKMSD